MTNVQDMSRFCLFTFNDLNHCHAQPCFHGSSASSEGMCALRFRHCFLEETGFVRLLTPAIIYPELHPSFKNLEIVASWGVPVIRDMSSLDTEWLKSRFSCIFCFSSWRFHFLSCKGCVPWRFLGETRSDSLSYFCIT